MDTTGKYKDSSDSMSYLEVCLLKMMNIAGQKTESQETKAFFAVNRPEPVNVPVTRTVKAEPEPVKEEPQEIIEEKPAEPGKNEVVEEKDPLPMLKAVKNLSDENFYDILSKSVKALKEADLPKWKKVIERRDVDSMAVISMLNGSYMMAESEKDFIVVVEDRLTADNINELSNLAKLEKIVEEEVAEEAVVEKKAKVNPFAVLGYIFAFLFPPLGLIFSIIGAAAAKDLSRGKGMAIAGIIVSLILCVVYAALAFLAFMIWNAEILAWLETIGILTATPAA